MRSLDNPKVESTVNYKRDAISKEWDGRPAVASSFLIATAVASIYLRPICLNTIQFFHRVPNNRNWQQLIRSASVGITKHPLLTCFQMSTYVVVVSFQESMAYRNVLVQSNRIDRMSRRLLLSRWWAVFPVWHLIHSMTNVSRAVDIGCRTGVATCQIAGMFPSA